MSVRRALLGLVAGAAACSPPVPERFATGCVRPLWLVEDGLYCASGGGVRALDRDGGERWLVMSVGDPFAVAGDEVFAAALGSRVVVLDRHGGAMLRAFAAGPVTTQVVAVAVAGDHVYWVERDAVTAIERLLRAPRAGGDPELMTTTDRPLRSLTADGATLWFTATHALGVAVQHLDDATGATTTLADLPGRGSFGTPLLVEPDRVTLATAGSGLDALHVDAVEVDRASGTPRVLATDTRGGVATGGGYRFLGTWRIAPDGATDSTFLPLTPSTASVVADDADVYWEDQGTIWRLPVDSAAPAPRPGDEPHPPLVGLPP